MGTVTAKTFCEAFINEWSARQLNNPRHLLDCYVDNHLCTDLMLGECGVLERTFERIKLLVADQELYFRRQWYTLDALIVGGQDLFDDRIKDPLHPSRIETLIEHENGDDWEVEMWKLLFWRAPLKVLIGYDYYEEDYHLPRRGRQNETRRDWLGLKVNNLRRMYLEVVRHMPEPNAEYLLLIGNRASRSNNSDVMWRWCRIDQVEPIPQRLTPPRN